MNANISIAADNTRTAFETFYLLVCSLNFMRHNRNAMNIHLNRTKISLVPGFNIINRNMEHFAPRDYKRLFA